MITKSEFFKSNIFTYLNVLGNLILEYQEDKIDLQAQYIYREMKKIIVLDLGGSMHFTHKM